MYPLTGWVAERQTRNADRLTQIRYFAVYSCIIMTFVVVGGSFVLRIRLSVAQQWSISDSWCWWFPFVWYNLRLTNWLQITIFFRMNLQPLPSVQYNNFTNFLISIVNRNANCSQFFVLILHEMISYIRFVCLWTWSWAQTKQNVIFGNCSTEALIK